jgi:hypothetical protein
MTSVLRKAAGALTILESVWVFYTQFAETPTGCPASGCPGPQFIPLFSVVAVGLGVILLADGIIGVWGASVAYPGGALVSAIVLLLLGYSAWAESGYAYLAGESYRALVGAALAAVAMAANLFAIGAGGKLSEQANPMNLPVFG